MEVEYDALEEYQQHIAAPLLSNSDYLCLKLVSVTGFFCCCLGAGGGGGRDVGMFVGCLLLHCVIPLCFPRHVSLHLASICH